MTPDSLQRTGDDPKARTLFDSTSRLAGEAAARSVGGRRAKILRFLRERGPATLFEIATFYGYFDHQISGRFTELARDGLIERTGERRTKPETSRVADVWRLKDSRASAPPPDLGDLLGYPQTLQIPGDGLFVKWPVLDADAAPAIPYVLHESAAGLRLRCRVSLIECDGCGRPVKGVTDRIDGKERRVWRCGTPTCNRTWHLQIVKEPGGPELLALVLKSL